jgi:ABC-type antimicrobial peptide transport system permease subunit
VTLVVGAFPTATQLRELGRVREVGAFAALHAFGIEIPRAPDLTSIAAAIDAKFADAVDRARVVAGRTASSSAVDEIAIGETLAAQLHIGVGSHLDAVSYSVAQTRAALATNANPGAPAGPHLRLRIVGIVRRPLDLGDKGASGGVFVLTPAFYRAYANRIGAFGTVFRIRTRRGAADVPAVVAAARQIFPHAAFFQVSPVTAESQGAASAIDVLTVALWIFAGVAALAGFVAVGIVLAREISLASVEQPTLRALGLTRRQRIAIQAYPTVLIAGAGVLLAVLGAVAASPLFPLGVARRADPNLGVHADWLILALGVIAISVVVGAFALVTALRNTRPSKVELDASLRRRPSKVVGFASNAGLPSTATNGLRMALEPGAGTTAVPVRSAYFGAVFGIVGITAVLMFTASLNHLTTTPRLYGWTADFAAQDNYNSGNSCGKVDYGLTHTAGIAAVAAACTQTVQLNGHPVNAWGYTSLRGTIQPEPVQGHTPAGPHDIALGTITLHDLHKHIGDTVQASVANKNVTYRIVGTVVFPELGGSQPLADGAAFTGAGLQHIFDPSNVSRYLFIRFAPAANRTRLEHHIASNPKLASPTPASIPPEIDRLRQIGWLPTTLAALLTTLAVLAVGHALITAVRRRRRELALLKTLGFTRRQVHATIAWQATTLATVGIALGIPGGLLLGTYVWHRVADNLGVTTTATVSTLAILLTIPIALALINLLAYLPGRAAAHTRPAVALRTE